MSEPAPTPAAPADAPAAASAPRSMACAVLGMMLNPGGTLKQATAEATWREAMLVSGSAFVLFFLQTGLDLARAGKAGAGSIIGLLVLGAVFGTAGVGLVGLLAWLLSRPFRSERALDWTMRAYALAYSPALVYGVCGVLANLALGLDTAIAFGVTGVLWALHPMMAVNDELTGGRRVLSALISTACGGVVLLGWSVLGAR